MSLEGNIRQITPPNSQSLPYLLEIESSGEKNDEMVSEIKSKQATEQKPPSRLQFSLSSEIINTLPQDVACSFLNAMTFKHYKKGERFIKQGEEGNHFYIILNGSCIVNLEENNEIYKVAELGPGDIVGEMAVFIGEYRTAHVDAETDIDLLCMSRERFETLSRKYPEFRNFLSEIITQRLSTSRVIADRKIGKYIITEKIDHGGFGIIYKGIHSMLDMPVAVKMLKHDMAMDPDFIEIFRNEAKTIAQLSHSNIIKVYDIEELYKTVFIIMEYLNGMPLDYVIKNTPHLPISKILDITVSVCYGLEYAHKHGVVHQDINPRNIFVESENQVKIIDFGLACPPGSIDCHFLFPGTIAYISPEQIRGDPVDSRTDIYSLGITVYEMITGEKPFPIDEVKKIFHMHLHEDIPDPRPKIPDLPDEIYSFLMRATRKDPSDRYQNVSEILSELLPLHEKFRFNNSAGTS